MSEFLEDATHHIQFSINKHDLHYTVEERVNKMTNFELLELISEAIDARDAKAKGDEK